MPLKKTTGSTSSPIGTGERLNWTLLGLVAMVAMVVVVALVRFDKVTGEYDKQKGQIKGAAEKHLPVER